MAQAMNAEKAKETKKLTQSNKERYANAKKEVTLVTQVSGQKEKYIKRVRYIDKETKSEISVKNSLLGIKKGNKMIFGTDKIEG